MQLDDDGYSRRGNFGGSLVRSMFLMYSADDSNTYGSRGGKFEGIGSLHLVESCKIMFLGDTSDSLVQSSDTFAVECIVYPSIHECLRVNDLQLGLLA